MDERLHKKLEVWKVTMDFIKEIYMVTSKFPSSEMYGIVSQMRRSSVSIATNLSEGAARKGSKEFKQFLNIAQGSVSELDTLIELSFELRYITEKVYNDLTSRLLQISKMLYGLARSIY